MFKTSSLYIASIKENFRFLLSVIVFSAFFAPLAPLMQMPVTAQSSDGGFQNFGTEKANASTPIFEREYLPQNQNLKLSDTSNEEDSLLPPGENANNGRGRGGGQLPTPTPTPTPSPTPTPGGSPTPTPSPTPVTPPAVFGLSGGMLAILNYDVPLTPPTVPRTAVGSLDRSFSHESRPCFGHIGGMSAKCD